MAQARTFESMLKSETPLSNFLLKVDKLNKALMLTSRYFKDFLFGDCVVAQFIEFDHQAGPGTQNYAGKAL